MKFIRRSILILATAVLCWTTYSAWGFQSFGSNISSASLVANTNSQYTTWVDDTSIDHKTCTFSNGPVWLTIKGVRAIKFDNSNARINCTEQDMPYGSRPRTWMVMMYASTPTANGIFHALGQSGGTFWRTGAGGALENGTGVGANVYFTLRIPTQTWCVIGSIYPGGASVKETAFMVTKSTFLMEQSANAFTYNLTYAFNEWGDWSISGFDCKCAMAGMMIVNRAMSRDEFLYRAEKLLRQSGVAE